MESVPHESDRLRSQLSLARAHLDIALGASTELAARTNIVNAWEICNAIAAELYKIQLLPGE